MDLQQEPTTKENIVNTKEELLGTIDVPQKPLQNLFKGDTIIFCTMCGNVRFLANNQNITDLVDVSNINRKNRNEELFEGSFDPLKQYFTVKACGNCELESHRIHVDSLDIATL
jgi:hypothetical protein